MMDFNTIATDGMIESSYAGKLNGSWVSGTVSADFLNKHFGQYTTGTEMKNATSSEGLQLFFDDLVTKGKIPA